MAEPRKPGRARSRAERDRRAAKSLRKQKDAERDRAFQERSEAERSRVSAEEIASKPNPGVAAPSFCGSRQNSGAQRPRNFATRLRRHVSRLKERGRPRRRPGVTPRQPWTGSKNNSRFSARCSGP
jgi:hypothetical protein